MFKGQKTLAALAVSLLFTAPVYAADEGSGEIHFKGEVIEAPCEIHQCLCATTSAPSSVRHTRPPYW